MYNNLLVDREPDGVWIVTLNRPDKRNALNAQTIEELVTLFSGAMLLMAPPKAVADVQLPIDTEVAIINLERAELAGTSDPDAPLSAYLTGVAGWAGA